MSTTFTPLDPASLPGPASLRDRRQRALDRFAEGPLPTEADDIWRFSRINDLDPGAYAAARPHASAAVPPPVSEVLELIGDRAAFALTVDGAVAAVEVRDEMAKLGVRLHLVKAEDRVGVLTDGMHPWDAFVELNTGQAPSPLVVSVAAGVVVPKPIVVCHWTATAGAVTFPRTLIQMGENARATVVEYLLSAPVRARVDPVTEVSVAAGAQLQHLVVQALGPEVWQTAYLTSDVARDASLHSFTMALGGDYARLRTDSRVTGPGASAELLALYCGDGSQMHDFRTLQDHLAPQTTSELVFKGAVQDTATSAYSGLIHVARGAVGTKAFQTNRNLMLSDTGLATYSIPNLDIEENDVSCSHASATGPIDEEQLFYLESRGVTTEDAERLIVLRVFEDLLDKSPVPALRSSLSAQLGAKLRIAGA